MPYVPVCKYDIFISYARKDDVALDGWVTQFRESLGKKLSVLLGSRFDSEHSIFFDTRELTVGQVPEEVRNAARKSAILVPVLSPHYCGSKWCLEETQEFLGGAQYGKQRESCVVPILISPVDDARVTPPVRNAHKFSFLDGKENISDLVSSEGKALVHDFGMWLAGSLRALHEDYPPVFLGKGVTKTAMSRRERFQKELESHGFRIVPDSVFMVENIKPTADPGGLRKSLQDSVAAIHFLGGADAAAMDAVEMSVVACGGPTILFRPFSEPLSPAEKRWLDAFQDVRSKVEEGNLDIKFHWVNGKSDQEMHAFFNDLVAEIRSPSGAGVKEKQDLALPSAGEKEESALALVCWKEDMASARQFRAEVESKKNIRVDLPEFLSGPVDRFEVARSWQNYFKRSRALLFYHGAADRQKLDDIWHTAKKETTVPSDWFLAPPAVAAKRKQYPEALWNIEQVIDFLEGGEK